jgi:hypothetical protein
MMVCTSRAPVLTILVFDPAGCTPSLYPRGGHPTGYSQVQVELDCMECEYKARLAD